MCHFPWSDLLYFVWLKHRFLVSFACSKLQVQSFISCWLLGYFIAFIFDNLLRILFCNNVTFLIFHVQFLQFQIEINWFPFGYDDWFLRQRNLFQNDLLLWYVPTKSFYGQFNLIDTKVVSRICYLMHMQIDKLFVWYVIVYIWYWCNNTGNQKVWSMSTLVV